MTPHDPAPSLLDPEDPAPVEILRAGGTSRLLLACDHAGRAVPRALGRLGIAEAEFDRHIAWDLGIAAVGRRLSAALDAPFVAQRYSRLVIDCNRPLGAPSSIPPVSDGTEVPANLDLPDEARRARETEIFRPYHEALAAQIDAMTARAGPPVLIALHSFTPVMAGFARPWHIGTLYGADARLAAILRPLFRADPGLVVGDNEPYAVGPTTDMTIPVHGEKRGLLHVGLEIRQDLLADPSGQDEWADRLAESLPRAWEEAGRLHG